MKTTAPDKIIVYDSSCPMCRWYTGLFVEHHMLSPQHRLDFSQLLPGHLTTSLDLVRAKHEIPLIDANGGPVMYGLDSMIHIIGSRFPVVKRVMQVKPLYAFAKKVYELISYNRRLIAGTPASVHTIDCTPDFNLKYRVAYILFALTIAVTISIGFGNSVSAYVPQALSPVQSLLIVGSGWVLQVVLAFIFLPGKRMDYLGHIATIMLIGVLVLLPGMLIQRIAGPVWAGIPVISVLLSSGLMLWEHIRRMKTLYRPQYWSLLWFLSLQVTAIFWIIQFKLI